MTNTKARNQLNANLRKHVRLWLYAKARGLSFARWHLNKANACIQALALLASPTLLATLVTAPLAVWSA